MSDERRCLDCPEMTRNEHGRCRDCDIEYLLDSMQCSGCSHMRYRQDGAAKEMAEYVWGDPCLCDPRPPSVYDVRKTSRALP